MSTVALETSRRAASVALRVGERTLESVLEAERAHARDLLPRLEGLLIELGSSADAIETVIVGTGPGSYTGLRVGIATAIGLARGCGAQLFGMPSLAALAYRALEVGQEGTVLLDARGAALYLARYKRLAHDVEEIRPPEALGVDEVHEQLDGGEAILGDDNVAVAAGLNEEQRSRLVTDVVPRAQDLLTLGTRRLETLGAMLPEEIDPLYLRPFVKGPQ